MEMNSGSVVEKKSLKLVETMDNDIRFVHEKRPIYYVSKGNK